MKRQRKTRGLLASAGALVTAAALALGGASAAFAAPTIAPSGTVNLNITKLSTPDGTAGTPDGTQQGSLPAGADPIQGVEFTVQRVVSYEPSAGGAAVSVDLTTNAGWQAAQTLKFNAAAGTWHDGEPMTGANAVTPTFGAALMGTTDANGVPQTSGNPSFQGMPIGLYHVAETVTPAGVTPAVPFIVSLPMTNPAGTDWMNTVYVYPKNAEVGFTKAVTDATAYKAGDVATYTLNADVPRVRNDANTGYLAPTQFVISDTIDTNLTPGAVTVNIVDAAGANLGTQPAVGTDYTVSAAGVSPVVVTFDSPGFTLLQSAAATVGAQVKVTIATTVKAGAGAAGDIANGGSTTALTYTIDGDTETLNPQEVLSKWRDVSFVKQNENNAALAGAVFGLFKTKGEADSNGSTPIATSTSAATTGTVAFNDIRVSDWQNGVAQTAGAKAAPADPTCTVANTDYRVYWLAETTAPTGYELLAQAIPVVITGAAPGVLQQVAVDGSGNAQFNADCSPVLVNNPLGVVKNVKDNAGFVLPLTGGMGTAILTILGVGILAVVLVVARRRRSHEAAAE